MGERRSFLDNIRKAEAGSLHLQIPGTTEEDSTGTADQDNPNTARMVLNILIDYSGAWEMEQAAKALQWRLFERALAQLSEKMNENESGRRKRRPRHRQVKIIDSASTSKPKFHPDTLRQHFKRILEDQELGVTDGNLFKELHIPRKVDLMIRTSGEFRLSDFMTMQTRYAEYVFVKTLFPEFGKRDFAEALLEYSRRQRRHGKTGEQMKRNFSTDG